MNELVCICESVYEQLLTRGNRYTALAMDDEKRQVRIKGDNGRIRWFPIHCFDKGDRPVTSLVKYQLDDMIAPSQDRIIEVTVHLSDGEQRWCIFATPAALASCGDYIDGTQVRFHYCNRHVIVAGELSEDLIGRMLRYIDSQGELAECTLSLADYSDNTKNS